MDPRLVCERTDFNDCGVVESVIEAAASALAGSANWYTLAVRSKAYFATPEGPLPEALGGT